MHFETGATRLWWGSSLKRPPPGLGGAQSLEGARTCHQGRRGLCPSRTSSFLDSGFKQGFLDLCLNEKRTGSTLCYENQILFTVKITSEYCPPLWIFQPAFCPQMYIKLVLRLGRRSIRLSSDLVLTGRNSLSLKPEK